MIKYCRAVLTRAPNRAMSSLQISRTQKVVLINETGDLDVIKYEDYPVPKIGANDILVKNRYAGVNFIESYFRKGIYPSEKPYILGREASGYVAAKGDQVTKFDVGDPVAYLSSSTFAQYTKFPENGNILKLPENSSDEELKLYAAALLQGLTALTFVEEAYEVKKDDYILVYAAAGGVGLMLDQLLKRRGAHTIAVVSSDEKASLARKNGAEFTINSSKEDILTRVREITHGKGVDAAFDSVGKDTFEVTLASIKRKGSFVSYGNASGPVPPFVISRLSAKNIKIMRPQLFGYLTEPEEWEHYSAELVKLISDQQNKFNVNIHQIYPLGDYKNAAKDLESRKTTGKLLLEIP